MFMTGTRTALSRFLLCRQEGQHLASKVEETSCICDKSTKHHRGGQCRYLKAAALITGAALATCCAHLRADELLSLEVLHYCCKGPVRGSYLLCRSEGSISVHSWRWLCLAGSSFPLVRLLLHCRRFAPHVGQPALAALLLPCPCSNVGPHDSQTACLALGLVLPAATFLPPGRACIGI